MAAITSNPTQLTKEQQSRTFKYRILTAATVLADGVVGLYGMGSNAGYASNLSAASGMRFVGFGDRKQTGDYTASPIPDVAINTMMEGIKTVTISDGAGSRADVDKLVYAVTNNYNDIVVTRPSDHAMPMGFILEWISGTSYRVMKFSAEMARWYAYHGSGRVTIDLGQYWLADATSGGYIVADRKLRGLGKLVRFYSHVSRKKSATNSESCVLTPEIDGTTTTGGGMTLSAVTTAGALASGAAITAGNKFRDGSNLKIKVGHTAALTKHTSGAVNLFLEYEPSY